MILKVMREKGFKFYGPFDEVEVLNVGSADNLSTTQNIETHILDPCHLLDKEDGPEKYWKEIHICGPEGRDPKIIQFCSPAFICCDDGKTIERI